MKKLLGHLKFWNRAPKQAPRLPQDIQNWNSRQRPFNAVQAGHKPEGAGINAVAIGAAIVVAIFAVGGLWLYFHGFLFSNDT